MASISLLACGSSAARDAARRAEVTAALKAHLVRAVDEWRAASRELADAAPTPSDRGWDGVADAQAISALKAAWSRGREAYERVEGALAPLFPESDTATDSRYEDHLVRLGAAGDPRPFDGEGVVGMHAIERVLWADAVPSAVVAYESQLPGYAPATRPRTADEAKAFKGELVGRLVRDVERLARDLAPLELDLAFVYRGLLDLVREQVEKVDKTASGEEESRYARATLRDLRANLRGCEEAYALVRPWLLEKRDGATIDARVSAQLAALRTLYDATKGDAMPEPPASWSGLDPTPADLSTSFGKLFAGVKHAADERAPGSLIAELRAAARALGMPEMP